MARNGSGTYALPAGNPVVTGTTISSTVQNNTMSDIATALTNSVAANGETPITADIPFNSKKAKGLASATTAGDALAYGQSAMGPLDASTIAASGLVTAAAGAKVGNVARADVLTLDWYEEATYVPTIAGSTTAGTPTYTSRLISYTRIGNRIVGQGEVLIAGLTGSAGFLTITLPVTASLAVSDSVTVGHGTINAATPLSELVNVQTLTGDGTKARFNYKSGTVITTVTASSTSLTLTFTLNYAV